MEKIQNITDENPKNEHIHSLHRQFKYFGKNARHWMRKCALLLLDIERERVWEKKGFGSIQEYARRLAGMNGSSVDENLRILHAIQDKPELMNVAQRYGLGSVRPVATIATIDTAKFWAEKASTMSKNTLETYVREVRIQQQQTVQNQSVSKQLTVRKSNEIFIEKNPIEQSLFEAEQLRPSTKLTRLISMNLDPDIAAELEKLKSDGDWNTLISELLDAKKQLLELQKPQTVDATSRHIPMEIQRYIMKRSKGRCEFPRCTKKYHIFHHAQRFALEEKHDPDLMVALCTAHERLAHMSLIDQEDQDASCWKILEQADTANEKFTIDQMVMRYRKKT